jgi:arylformamidase
MIHDISMPLREGMPVYAGNPPYRRIVTNEIQKGDVCNQSRFEFGAHCGTHIDAPWHFEKDGFTTDRVPLDNLVGPARLLHVADPVKIDLPDLEKLDWTGVERVLFRTRNSDHWKKGGGFDPKYVYLSGPAARFLVEKKMKLVGIDSLGVEQFGSKEFPTHHALLPAGITVLEGLWLADVPPGDYYLFCGPLRVEGGDGTPARAFLMDRPPGK